MIRMWKKKKNYAACSPRPIHRSSSPGWLGNPRGIFFVCLINMLVGVVLLVMRFCMFCIPRICYHILHDRTFWRRKILEKTFKACQHQGAGRFANNISWKRHRKDDGRLENENRHLSRSLPQRTILLSSSTLATCTAFQ